MPLPCKCACCQGLPCKGSRCVGCKLCWGGCSRAFGRREGECCRVYERPGGPFLGGNSVEKLRATALRGHFGIRQVHFGGARCIQPEQSRPNAWRADGGHCTNAWGLPCLPPTPHCPGGTAMANAGTRTATSTMTGEAGAMTTNVAVAVVCGRTGDECGSWVGCLLMSAALACCLAALGVGSVLAALSPEEAAASGGPPSPQRKPPPRAVPTLFFPRARRDRGRVEAPPRGTAGLCNPSGPQGNWAIVPADLSGFSEVFLRSSEDTRWVGGVYA
jgi:hypothetical protein